MKSKNIIMAVIVTVAVLAAVVFGYLHHKEHCMPCLSFASFSPESIRHYIQGFGSWAILVYVCLYVVNTITLFPPIALMSLSSGVLFGPVLGILALALGSFCGTSATFFIARYAGGRLVERVVKGKAAAFNEKISRNGFIVLLPMRVIGLPPYEFVNYAAGLSKITYRDYISATMLGMSPAIILQPILSDKVFNFDPKDPVLYVAVLLYVAMGVITAQVIKRKQVADKAAGKV